MLGSLKWMALLASIVLVACAPEENGNGGGGGDDDDDGSGVIDAGTGPGFIDATDLPEGPDAAPGACDKMDILFVIDNSGSMDQEQDNLAANFPMFAQLIEDYTNSAGMQLDYHVGVTTTDRDYSSIQIIPGNPPTNFPGSSGTGNNGKLLTKGTGPDCGMPRKWLQRGDQDVVGKFSCIAKQGTSGSPDEMPLDAMKLALVDRMADTGPNGNSGFLRPDALLAIVFLTDEEDCSLYDPSVTYNFNLGPFCSVAPLGAVEKFVQAVDQVKGGERGRWAVAAIAGPGPGKCSSPYGGADEATRLKQFTQMVGNNAVFSSICDANLAGSLTAAFDKFSAACESFPPVD